MKQIIRKEFREQLKIAVPAFLLLTLVLLGGYQSCSTELSVGVAQRSFNRVESVDPLLSQSIHMWVVFVCGATGAALGAMQVFSERPRDRWAFFIHRPLTRKELFVAKITAGLTLYLAAVLPPIVGLIAIAATPGHIAAPFEWLMTLPLLHAITAGIVFYFAGMTCALRPVRWYGSKLLPLGAAFLAAIASSVPQLHAAAYVAWAVTVLLVVATLFAALGNFEKDGYVESQPRVTKLATIATLVVGVTIAWSLIGVICSWMPRHNNLQPHEWYHFTMSKDGTPYKIAYSSIPGERQKIYDLQGNRITNSNTGKPLYEWLNSAMAFGPSFPANRFIGSPAADSAFFGAWKVNGRDIWYWTRPGNLEGFDTQTRLPLGAIEARDPFLPTDSYLNVSNPPDTICSSNKVYLINLEQRTAKPIWTAPPGEQIVGSQEARYRIEPDDPGPPVVAIATPKRVVLIACTNAEVMLDTPVHIHSGDNVVVRFLRSGQFSVWVTPPYHFGQPPTKVLYIAANGSVTRQIELPAIPAPRTPTDIYDQILPAIAPPVVTGFAQWRVNGEPMIRQITKVISVILSIVCAIIALIRERRYGFSIAAQIGWTITIVLFGVPGLVTLLGVYQWPNLVRCPQCGKPRVVTREQCGHCAAEFPTTTKVGVEIFAPLAKA